MEETVISRTLSTINQKAPSPTPSIPRTPRDFKAKAVKVEESIPVFNRTHGMLGFMESDTPYIEIPAGRWTTTTTNGKAIPKDFIYRYLINNPDLSVHLPYKPLRGDRTHLTVAAPLVSTTGWGIFAGNAINELAKLRLANNSLTSDQLESVKSAIDFLQDPDAFTAKETADGLARQSDLVLFPLANWYYQEMPELTQALMRKPHHNTEWTLAMTIPSDLPAVPSPNTILFSMWETSRLPNGWRELMIQNNVRHIIVPSHSQVELFKQGWDGDVDVVPLGIDPNVWRFYARPQRSEDEIFTILLYGTLSARKSPIETVVETCWRAFSSAFGEPVDNWRIILKTRAGALSGGLINDPHVEIKNYDATPRELWELTHQADVGIFLSRFEGFGLPSIESMASGLPVILSDNSGHSDICNPEINIPVPTEEIIQAKELYNNEKENWTWNEPSFFHAAEKLREQYDDWVNRGRTQSEMGIKASKWIHANRTWKQTAQGINAILEKVIPN